MGIGVPPHDQTSAECQRERYSTKNEVDGRYEEEQHEAACEAKPREEGRGQSLLPVQVQSREMGNGKPHQQVKTRKWQDFAQIEYQHDCEHEKADGKHGMARYVVARMYLA